MAPFQPLSRQFSQLRLARWVDRPNIERLIERSARALCQGDYSSEVIEAALGSAWGIDSQLIVDQTYFVVEADGEEASEAEDVSDAELSRQGSTRRSPPQRGRGEPGTDSGHAVLVAAGGWSYRKTLFGADARPDRSPEALDPAREAAKIRAFFVAPEFARRGIGRILLAHCEREAAARGFRACELAATLTGERLYRALGYSPRRRFAHPLRGGLHIDFVEMHKRLA
jgi:GNAT superfamily N-acetyltransferase